MKVVFLGFKLYLSFLEGSQHYFNIFLILLQVLRVDKNIVQVTNVYNIQLQSKQVIKSSLVYYQYIRESEQHNLVLIESILGSEYCFLFFLFLDLYQVVYFTEVQLSKQLSSLEPIPEFVYKGQCIPIFDSDLIKLSIVNTESLYSIYLLGIQYRASYLRL